ncbi:MAG: peptidoglycan-binding protein [Coriobacteriia bacterium]|nr:peptidoglycan-binding protein [Coriobacteriia bacterium]
MTVRIQRGARGPAVEDVQKRLLKLGYDLGRAGVDGVFMGATLEAVRRFQREHGLVEDGVVGPRTWAALVDATFTLGDRILYLRYPYLHGADVATLQTALNVLGFPCGEVDGIFGPCTEGAVREFQFNAGLPADGVAGDETLRAIERLRHVWSGKDPAVPAALTPGPARTGAAFADATVCLAWCDSALEPVCRRAANLVKAVSDDARVAVRAWDPVGSGEEDVEVLVGLVSQGAIPVPTVRLDLDDPVRSAARMVTALASVEGRPARIAASMPAPRGEEEAQRLAVLLVDALAAALG